MHISLLAWGTRGDVEPFVALGMGLQKAGHEVSVAASTDLSDLVTSRGLDFQPFNIDMAAAFNTETSRRWVEKSRGPHREGVHINRVVHEMAPVAAEGLERILSTSDALISGMLTYESALSAAKHLGLKHIRGLMAPMTPTASGEALLYPALSRRHTRANLVLSLLMEAALFQLVRPGGDVIRERLDMPRGTYRGYVQMSRQTPTIVGVSPEVIPPPADWRGLVDVTGYWQVPCPVDYEPPADLADFLAADRPPIYLGFGSMPSSTPQQLWHTVTTALARTGERAVVRFRWQDWQPESEPENIFVIKDAVPFDWLFPRTRGVVHHGGSGTTGTALHAGVPQWVVPHMADQPYFGRRMHQIGVGPAPVPLHKLNADRLAAGITQLTNDRAFRATAARLGERVNAEDGVGRAVAVVERTLC
ncbi:glycosyltransferase [Propionibacteriaceae bacterium G1746]